MGGTTEEGGRIRGRVGKVVAGCCGVVGIGASVVSEGLGVGVPFQALHFFDGCVAVAVVVAWFVGMVVRRWLGQA